jgi:hypothetical protein
MKFARSIRWLGSSAVKSLTALSAILLTGPTAARAVDLTAIQAKVKEIISKGKIGCQKDLDQYCSDVTPGHGRLAFCLIAHADKRSATCEAALKAARSDAEEILNTIDAAIDACQPDIAAHCSSTEPGEGRIAQCLVDQRAALSQNCGEVVDVVGEIIFRGRDGAVPGSEAPSAPPATEAASSTEAQPAAQPVPTGEALVNEVETRVQAIIAKAKIGCQGDLDKFCAHITPGEGRLALCLVAHADKRSPQCESALFEARSEAETIIKTVDIAVEACGPDIVSLCSGTEPGEGRIAQCLADQRPALSANCGTVFDVLSRVIYQPRNEPVTPESTAAAAGPEPAEVEKDSCQTLHASVTDWSQSATSQDARSLLKKRVAGFVAKRGLTDYKSGGISVKCTANFDLLIAGNYTCTARSVVCWPGKKE